MGGFTLFEFDLATPLFEQIRICLDEVEPSSLTLEDLREGTDGPGVYMLIHKSTPVYIGKAEESVVRRLLKHRRVISGRQNIQVEDVQFKSAIFARTWNPFLPEKHLIDHYGTKRHWNYQGFGANDPGRKRYTTKYKAKHFFKMYPINQEFDCSWLEKGQKNTRELCRELRTNLPFWVKTHEIEDVPESSTTTITREHPRLNEVLKSLMIALGHPWRICVIPSHVLIEHPRSFGTGRENRLPQYPDMDVITVD